MTEEPGVERPFKAPAGTGARQVKLTAWSKAMHYARSVMAISVWTYIILKLFVLDIDELLVRRFFPQAAWLVEFRGVLILAIFAVLAVLAWGFRLLGWMLYIAFFPLVLLFWHAPAFVIRRRAWTLSVALIAAGISVAQSLRWAIIVAGCLVVGATLVAAGIRGAPVIAGMVLLGGGLLAIYAKSGMDAFRSSQGLFSSQSLDKLWRAANKGFTPNEEIRQLHVEAMTEAQRNIWIANLQLSVLYGSICYFVARKL